MEQSLIEFQRVKDQTVVTQQYSVKPLKIINPKSSESSSYCVLSNYGGGFVQGDTIQLHVKCGDGTNSLISSQANTRIFEANGRSCKQELRVELGTEAFHVLINDPLVIHKGGSFTQESRYDLKHNSVLLLVDWFVGGRTANGEDFAFNEYSSDNQVKMDGKPVIWDKFHLTPDEMDIKSPALLGDSITFMNIFLVGNEDLEKVKLLENGLLTIEEMVADDERIKSSIDRVNKNSCVGRFASGDVLSFKRVVNKLSEVLAHKSLLRFDPMKRKY